MDTFSALGDPNRRHIVELLAKNGQLAAGDIYGKFSVSPQAISQHLKILKEAKIVKVEKRAQQRIYTINTKSIQEIEDWASKMGELWNARLDRLDKALQQMKKESKEKTCSRGHKYTGSGACPVCWPGRLKKEKTKNG